jgi:hypothetical protein
LVKIQKNIFFIDRCVFSFIDRRKGVETIGNDFNVPEYLLPNQKDVQLIPLFTTNTKVNVNRFNVFIYNNFFACKIEIGYTLKKLSSN